MSSMARSRSRPRRSRVSDGGTGSGFTHESDHCASVRHDAAIPLAPTKHHRAGGSSGWATSTTSRPSMPTKSSGLQVYRGRSLAIAIAAIIAS